MVQPASSPVFTPRSHFLPFSPPHITEEEIEAVTDTLRSDWISTGPKTRQFEQQFAQFIGCEAALALNSCTSGLHLALVVLGIGPGDEVILTTTTFCASAHVIVHTGATPVFVDIEPDTMNMDPRRIEEAITPRTRAIMVVHLAGHPVDMDAIRDIAERNDLYIIEDAAHALPAAYKGEMVGTIGDLTAFSFYATKNLTTGEGGMLTGRRDLIDRARIWSLHGMNREALRRYEASGSWYYEVVSPGYKYNMSDIQAALGLVQLRRLGQLQQRRYEIVQRYNRAFAQIPEVEIPTARDNVQHAWHLYILRLNLHQLRIDRNRFIDELKARNIGTSVHFIPLFLHPYYAETYSLSPRQFPVAYRQFKRAVSLPLNSRLSDQDVDDIVASVADVIDKSRR
jgi:dTDP-4-amino-4,6-dideoxygalactose transaminase